MDLQNLSYALVQVAHNFGAAAVVGAAVFALWPARQGAALRRKLVWSMLVAWLVQAASGAGFGLTSYHYYGQLPDIHGVAAIALGIKVLAVVAGLLLAALYLRRSPLWSEARAVGAVRSIAALAVTALTAAAFLRWYA